MHLHLSNTHLTNKGHNPSKHQGFSLIEMVIVIVIIGIIGVLGSRMLNSGFNAYFLSTDLTEIDWQGRLAM